MRMIIVTLTLWAGLLWGPGLGCTKPSSNPSATGPGGTTPPGTTGPTGTGGPGATCRVVRESTTFAGQKVYWEYEYGDNGLPTLITSFTGGGPSVVAEVGDLEVVKTNVANDVVVATEYDAVLSSYLPTFGAVSVTIDDVTTVNWRIYAYEYDDKGRIASVIEGSPYVANDWEWTMDVTYDDRDNVTELYSYFTTGPDTFTSFTVSAYDDHPTPYASMRGPWRFIQGTFSYDTPEIVPLITSMSANNPLDYTVSGVYGVSTSSAISYTYDATGFPATSHHELYGFKDSQYDQTYSYECD